MLRIHLDSIEKPDVTRQIMCRALAEAVPLMVGNPAAVRKFNAVERILTLMETPAIPPEVLKNGAVALAIASEEDVSSPNRPHSFHARLQKVFHIHDIDPKMAAEIAQELKRGYEKHHNVSQILKGCRVG
jgi:hypothetical protein